MVGSLLHSKARKQKEIKDEKRLKGNVGGSGKSHPSSWLGWVLHIFNWLPSSHLVGGEGHRVLLKTTATNYKRKYALSLAVDVSSVQDLWDERGEVKLQKHLKHFE